MNRGGTDPNSKIMKEFEAANKPGMIGHDIIEIMAMKDRQSLFNFIGSFKLDFSGICQGKILIMISVNPNNR